MRAFFKIWWVRVIGFALGLAALLSAVATIAGWVHWQPIDVSAPSVVSPAPSGPSTQEIETPLALVDALASCHGPTQPPSSGETGSVLISQGEACWASSARVDPSTFFYVLIEYRNHSGEQADNVSAALKLDQGFRLLPATTYWANAWVPDGVLATTDDLATVGINTGSYLDGANSWWLAKVMWSPTECGRVSSTISAWLASDLERTTSTPPITSTAYLTALVDC